MHPFGSYSTHTHNCLLKLKKNLFPPISWINKAKSISKAFSIMSVQCTCIMRKLRTTIFMTKTKHKKNKDLQIFLKLKIFYLWRWKMEIKITAPVFTFLYTWYTFYHNATKYKMFQGLCFKNRWFGFHTLPQKLHRASTIKSGNGWTILVNLPTAYLWLHGVKHYYYYC